jgi:hypothetical protein
MSIAFPVPENLAFDNYQALIDTINDWMDRSDLTGSAPSMIALCEARLRRELQPLVYEKRVGVSVVDGVGGLPSDFDAMRSVTNDGVPIDEVSPEIARQYAPGQEPRAYSLEANQLRIWPAWTGSVNILYHAKLEPLSQANQTNPIIAQHPDVYFFGSMMFAEGYLANDQRAALFKSMWDEALEGLKQYYRRQRRDRPRLRAPGFVV